MSEFEHIIDEGGVVWAKYGVVSQPAFTFINDDGSIDTRVGSLGPERLTEAVEQLTAT